MSIINRRNFIKASGSFAAGLSIAGPLSCTESKKSISNRLPKWKGFNILDFFSPDPVNSREPIQEEYFKWMTDWGFDFVRFPMAYAFPGKIQLPFKQALKSKIYVLHPAVLCGDLRSQ